MSTLVAFEQSQASCDTCIALCCISVAEHAVTLSSKHQRRRKCHEYCFTDSLHANNALVMMSLPAVLTCSMVRMNCSVKSKKRQCCASKQHGMTISAVSFAVLLSLPQSSTNQLILVPRWRQCSLISRQASLRDNRTHVAKVCLSC